MKHCRIRLIPEHRLALMKVNFEAQSAQNKLSFMLGYHADRGNADYLQSEAYNRLLEDSILKDHTCQQVGRGIVELIVGVETSRLQYEYLDEHKFLDLWMPEDTDDTKIKQYVAESVKYPVDNRKMQYQDFIAKIYPELHGIEKGQKKRDYQESTNEILSRTVTFQVTDKCNLACTYCYQINKGVRKMSLSDAKLFIDKILSGADGFDSYISVEKSPAIILEFIGGEPFLEVELIDQIVDYFRLRCIELEHPWADRFCISICSNGVLYTDPQVQHFLQKNRNNISFSVTLDGNKALHDACRVFADGTGSYDIAEAAAMDWMHRGYAMGSKITISPDNLPFIYGALKHITELGYTQINANCVYEAKWTNEQAKQLYELMVAYADYLLSDDNETLDCSLFSAILGTPKAEDDVRNWCGGTGSMLAIDPDGWLYPCIRYMESSLGDTQKPLRVGNVHTGLARFKDHKDCVDCLNAINRRTQSTDECFYCPIAEGCSWCSAWNYQCYGTPDKRCTNICAVHKGRVLANVYYWNKYYEKYGRNEVADLWIPEEWAIPIIGRAEYEKLAEMVEKRGGTINRDKTMIKGYKAKSKQQK